MPSATSFPSGHAASAFAGQRSTDEAVTLHEFATRDFVVHSRSGHAWAGIDGESMRLPTPLRFASHPKGLRLLVPPATIAAAERRRVRDVSI